MTYYDRYETPRKREAKKSTSKSNTLFASNAITGTTLWGGYLPTRALKKEGRGPDKQKGRQTGGETLGPNERVTFK